MQLYCIASLFLVFLNVESFHERRYHHHHMGRGLGGWNGYNGGGYNYHRYRENRRHWRREVQPQSNLFKASLKLL
jgi:hypothetical protein